jgi:cell division protein FtsB
MDSRRKSLRESLRIEPRDYSLVAVAAMFVIFGLAFSNSVIPNYHRQQSLEARRAELQQQVNATKNQNARIEDEILALDDPYYMAQKLINDLKYTYAPPKDSGQTPVVRGR